MDKEFTLEWESDEICQIARNGDYMGTDEVVDLLNHQKEKIQELQERNNRQCELLEKQQEQIDNYIDIKAKLDGKIAEYTTKSEEYELGACTCGSRKYAYKTDALIEFKEEVFKK